MKSRMGAFFPGSHVIFRGHDLHAELKDMDWVELYVFGITGRRFSAEQLRLMHAIWTYTSYPDVRLWNNRVAALAGSARSTGALGVAAALAVSEASIYGGGISLRAIDFFDSHPPAAGRRHHSRRLRERRTGSTSQHCRLRPAPYQLRRAQSTHVGIGTEHGPGSGALPAACLYH
ncbi:hypothetical protein ACFS07_15430 [Undibacterium arcticum]